MSAPPFPTPPAGLSIPEELWSLLHRAYSQDERAYHSWAHIQELAARFDEVSREHKGWKHPVEIFLALLFHDAVYVPGARDNELQSARLAALEINRWISSPVDAEYVERLILLTARHGSLGQGDVSDEEALFLDCDMAILGAAPEAFHQYDEAIRIEYAALTAEAFQTGRRTFVQKLLAMPSIYLSPYFRRRLEGPARRNLTSLLAARL